MLIHGGPRASIDCLRLYLHNVDITYASFKVLRGLLQNPSTMMKFRKQKRFRIIPATVMDGVYRHENLDIKAEAAHTLWTYAGVGGADAQELVISAGDRLFPPPPAVQQRSTTFNNVQYRSMKFNDV